MCPHELRAEVRAFVAKYLRTYEELQVLAVLGDGENVSLAQIENQLGVSRAQARLVTDALRARGVLEQNQNGTFHLAARSEIRNAVSRIVVLCDADPTVLIQLLSANALARVRVAAHEAFRRRGDK